MKDLPKWALRGSLEVPLRQPVIGLDNRLSPGHSTASTSLVSPTIFAGG